MASANYSNWELIGKRIEVVERANSKGAKGTITNYDATKRVHTIQFENGDIQELDLMATDYHFLSSKNKEETSQSGTTSGGYYSALSGSAYDDDLSYGSGGGRYGSASYSNVGGGAYGSYGVYGAKFTPYVSRIPNANTRVTFHILMDSRYFFAGDTVRINGNLAQMSEWADGVPMEQDISDSSVWTITLNLPFAMSDNWPAGLFEFRYEIVSGSDGAVITEGQFDRTEPKLRSHFYHTFRPNYRVARFRNAAYLQGKAAFLSFLNVELSQHKDGLSSAREFMGRYRDLAECLTGTMRIHVEELLESEIAKAERQGRSVDDELLLLYLAMIGFFGLTSNEKMYVGYSNYNYNYPYGGTGVNSVSSAPKMTFKSPPKPDVWEHYCAEKIDVPALFARNLFSILGEHYIWAVRGLAEGVERLSEHGFFNWLVLMPLLMKHNVKPKIASTEGTGRAAVKKSEAFQEVSQEICVMIAHQQEVADAALEARRVQLEQLTISKGTGAGTARAATTDTSQGAAKASGKSTAAAATATATVVDGDDLDAFDDLIGLGDLADETKIEALSRDPPALDLIRRWLHALIKYAPTLVNLPSLLNTDMKMYGAQLVVAFAERIEQELFSTEEAFNVMESIMEKVPELKCPRLAAALLKNDSADGDMTNRTLGFIHICTDALSNSADTPPEGTEGLQGDWLELNGAAKEWIRRNHSNEPVTPGTVERVDTGSSWYKYGGWSGVGPKGQQVIRKPPTEAELLKTRKSSLNSAVTDVDALLQIPFFTRNHQGVIFELGRCWSLNGPTVTIGEALCSLAAQDFSSVAFGQFASVPLRSMLVARLMKLVKEAAPSRPQTISLLRVATQNLSREADLLKDVYYHAIVFATWPDMQVADIQNAFDLGIDRARAAIPNSATVFGSFPSPSLRSILDNEELWTAITQSYDGIDLSATASSGKGEVTPKLHPLVSIIIDAAGTISKSSDDIAGDVVSVESLNVIARQMDSFLDLSRLFDRCPSVPRTAKTTVALSRSVLELRVAALTKFDQTLEQVQTFASFFCSCGVRVQAADLRSIVEDLRKRYNQLKSKDLYFAFGGVLALPHVSWLYELRSSELFLHLWRAVGREICVESVEGAKELLAQEEAEQDGFVLLPGLFDEAEDAAAAAAEPEAPVAALDEEAQIRAAEEQFRRQDRRTLLVGQVEDVVLPQEIVVGRLIPRARAQWEQLARETFTKAVDIKRLEKTFGSLHSDSQMAEELRLLSSSITAADLSGPGAGGFSLSAAPVNPIVNKKSLVADVSADLKDFLLLRRLCKWLPSLIKVHDMLISLFTTPADTDPLRSLLSASIAKIRLSWETQTLRSIPALVSDVREIFSSFTPDQLDFLSSLAGSPDLTAWLLARSSTEEFNRLLQVVRPCTDEPRLLSAIASLVHVRTLLLGPLYNLPPYDSLQDFMDAFHSLDIGTPAAATHAPAHGHGKEPTTQTDSALWHLNNIISSFDALMEVFEKHTLSPGIKSCYDLRDIRTYGTFVLRANVDQSKVLTLVMVKSTGSDEGSSATDTRTESVEYLLDLRSKLLMTEVPKELEEEMQMSTMVDAFVSQLQVLSEMVDVLVNLYTSGHVGYQEEFCLKVKFELDGLPDLQRSYSQLREDAAEWAKAVKSARSTYFYLNFFTMREILRMRSLVLAEPHAALPEEASGSASASASNAAATVTESTPVEDQPNIKAAESSAAPAAVEEPDSLPTEESILDDGLDLVLIQQIEELGFSHEWAAVALRKTGGGDVNQAVEYCLSYGLHMDRIVEEEVAQLAMARAMNQTSSAANDTDTSKPTAAAASASSVNETRSKSDPETEFLGLLHQLSSQVSAETAKKAMEMWKTFLQEELSGRSESILTSLGEVLQALFGRSEGNSASGGSARSAIRELSPPSAFAANRGDLLCITDDTSEKRLPVFVACAEDPSLVIDTVLSVYVRRGRMPEPGEVFFCTPETTSEELSNLLMRFVKARPNGYGDSVYCLADIHNLSYTQQCNLVELLRGILQEHGQESASTLLIVSGLPRQVVLNSLSAQLVDLPPLPAKHLRIACQEAFRRHCGETTCVASTINGGGKTHFIKSQIARRQHNGELLFYCKIPIRESTSPEKLVELLIEAKERCTRYASTIIMEATERAKQQSNKGKQESVGRRTHASLAAGSSTAFEAGAEIEGNYKGGGMWLPGTIILDCGDGSYSVSYGGLGIEDCVPQEYIRRKGAAAAATAAEGSDSRGAKKKGEAFPPSARLPPITAPSTVRFAEGLLIEANFRRLGNWLPGRIAKDRGDGSYDIVYREHIVERSEIRVRDKDVAAASQSGSLAIGTKVEANYKGRGVYFPGKVSLMRREGTYDIKYDDGDHEVKVERKNIRKVVETSGSSPLAESQVTPEVGMRVETSLNRDWYPARVAAVNEDGTISVSFIESRVGHTLIRELVEPQIDAPSASTTAPAEVVVQDNKEAHMAEIAAGSDATPVKQAAVDSAEAPPVPPQAPTDPKAVPEMAAKSVRVVYHVDIGHIIPAVANTMLFQLLFVGVLRDPVSSRVYYRSKDDIFRIEVPNSLRNRTAIALHFCNLLPTVVLDVSSSELKLERPMFTDGPCSQLSCPEYSELISVSKWLRAIKNNRLERGSANYCGNFSPWTDANVSADECFQLLRDMCAVANGPSPRPSFSIFHTFVMFLNFQFTALESYDLLSSGILDMIDGLENFKKVFVQLLVETSKDFSLRSVPQIAGVGPPANAETASGGMEVAVGLAAHAMAPGAGEAKGDDGFDDDDMPPPPPRRLERQTSSDLRNASIQADVAGPPRLVRQTSEDMVRRFQSMMSWEQTDHPVVSFKMDGRGGVSGVDILSLNPAFVQRYINGNLKANLEATGFKFDRDWSKITNEEGVEILRQVEGLSFHERGGVRALEPGYVMTIDNVLKMLSIQLRLRFDIPVVIMGETGCGKSTLIRNMCAILGVPLHTLNVHGGIEDHDIITWMEERFRIAAKMPGPNDRLIVFLDEINTCNCMGLFKEIVCDRTMNGRPIPNRVKIIAACNPYRLRTTKSLYGGEEMAGLAFEAFAGGGRQIEGVGTGITDPLRDLVYRVHPLPESMIDFVYDFGALSSETERLYIKAMIRRQLSLYSAEVEEVQAPDAPADVAVDDGDALFTRQTRGRYQYPRWTPFGEFVEVFSELICAAQECIRDLAGGERSTTSLRDVSRCMKVFAWFASHFEKTKGAVERWSLADFYSVSPRAQRYVQRAVVLSLAYCYHARLPRAERKVMVNRICKAWRDLQLSNSAYSGGRPLTSAGYAQQYFGAKCSWLNLEPNVFNGLLEDTQREFVSKMSLGDGIALNEAILENLFMILVSVLNQIPIFVIGKPGSSKSLAMGLVQSNLNGDASDNDFLRTLPAVEVFSYQCSPLSTSAGIEQAFESSRRYRREAPNTVVVVLLDEVGLAEQSPHLPLKVLHKMLDEAGEGEAVVGISNWALDPAKMNRAVHLYRPAPTVEDLSLTAEGMVRSANLKGYLQALARAYCSTYQLQQHADFWGLREFYSTVRAINTALARRRAQTGVEAVVLDAEILLSAVLRNFGGRPHEMERVIKSFFSELGLTTPQGWKDTRVEDLVIQNLGEPDARHLMLLTKNNAALSLLLDRGILKQEKTEIIFGSDFPLDQNDLQVCLNIQRVKLCMSEGITVVLVHCDSLYESLYDLLNQHYVEYGGQTYVRLAFGTYTRLCPIHKMFRVVVVVETVEAYTKLAPPLLNRFEKQVFDRKDVLRKEQLVLFKRLHNFAVAFATAGMPTVTSSAFSRLSASTQAESSADDQSAAVEPSMSIMRAAFCGYHSDMISSLILATEPLFQRKDAPLKSEEGEPAPTDSESGTLVGVDHSNGASLEDRLFMECARRLLWIATPEAACRVMGKERSGKDASASSKGANSIELSIAKEYGIKCSQEYFMQQRHSSLAAFVQFALLPATEHRTDTEAEAVSANVASSPMEAQLPDSGPQSSPRVSEAQASPRELDDAATATTTTAAAGPSDSTSSWTDELGAQVIITSYSPLTQDAAGVLESLHIPGGKPPTTTAVCREGPVIGAGESKGEVEDHNSENVSGPSAGLSVTHIVLHELDQERTLRQMVTDFFKKASQTSNTVSTLLVQCDPLATSKRRIEHTKFVIELARARHLKAFKEAKAADPSATSHSAVHVILLLHLPRGGDEGDSRYCVDFDTRWRYAFVDSIVPAQTQGLPDVESMIGKTMSEAVSSLELKKVLFVSFRSALARLVFQFERTNEDVRRQISTILRALEDSDFVAVNKMLLDRMLPLTAAKDLDVGAVSQEQTELLLAGTFQGALHLRIIDTVSSLFAVTLSHMDRNNSLSLLLQPQWRDIWLYLLGLSFNVDVAVAGLNRRAFSGARQAAGRERKRTGDVQVKSDGYSAFAFSSRFPFSFYLASVIDSMRKIAEMGGDEFQLQRQFVTVGLQHGLAGELPDDSIAAYVYDFTCMKCRAVAELSREDQASLLLHILTLMPPTGAVASASAATTAESGEKSSQLNVPDVEQTLPDIADRPLLEREDSTGYSAPIIQSVVTSHVGNLAAVHHRFWRCERVLELYFELLNVLPSTISPVTEYLKAYGNASDTTGSLPTLSVKAHAAVLNIVMDSLEPWEAQSGPVAWNKAADYDTWQSSVRAVRSHARSLMDLINDAALFGSVASRWARIEFIYAFVREVAVPLDLEPSVLINHLRKFQDDTILKTQKALRSLLGILVSLSETVLKKQVKDADLYLCPISLKRMVDPVITSDGITYERSAITQWFSLGHTTSPATNRPLENTVLIPNDELREKLRSSGDCDLLGRFLEYFLFDVIFARADIAASSLEVRPGIARNFVVEDLPLDLVSDLAILCTGRSPMETSTAPVTVEGTVVDNGGKASNVLLHARHEKAMKDLRKISFSILPSSSARTGILRELFKVSSPAVQDRVRAIIADELLHAVTAADRLDAPFSLLFLVVFEERLSSVRDAAANLITEADISALSNIHMVHSNPMNSITAVAKARFALKGFAELLCKLLGDDNLNDNVGGGGATRRSKEVMIAQCTEQSLDLSPLLMVADQSGGSRPNDKVVHSMRLFLLKQIERTKGVSFLRSALMQPPLRDAPWLVQWLSSGDLGFTRFLGANMLPKINPLVAFPLFKEVQSLVSQYLASGSLTALEAGLGQCLAQHAESRVHAALLLALFHEINLLAVLPTPPSATIAARRDALIQWIASSTFFGGETSTWLRNLLLLFTTGRRSRLVAPAPKGSRPVQENAASPLQLDTNSTTDAILRARIAAHVTAAALIAPDNSPLRFFKTLIVHPEIARGTFFPTMPEDVLKMAQDIMGGRWYRCPNQHPYYVDLCGRPTVIQKCAQCGAQIGGLEHNLLADNVDIGNVGTAYYQQTVVEDNSDKDYCLRSAREEAADRFACHRTLNPTATRLVRLLMNTAMLVGSTAFGGEWDHRATPLFNKTYSNITDTNLFPGGIPGFLSDHILADWQLLRTMLTRSVDDVEIIVHLVLLACSGSALSDAIFVRAPLQGDAIQNTQIPDGTDFRTLATGNTRSIWEKAMNSGYISRLVDSPNLGKMLEDAEAMLNGDAGADDGAGVFAAELLEKVDLNSLSPAERKEYAPGLWQFTRSFNLSHFIFTLSMIPGVKEKYPVLSAFVEGEGQLRSLRHMPAVFEWFRLLRGRYAGTLDRETARRKSCAEAIAEVTEHSERMKWQEAFHGFMEAWNSSWPSVLKFGCLSFPSEFNSLRMDPTVAISFCLPNESDEGLCPLALTQYLVNKHNDFVQIVDEVLLLRDTRSRQESSRAKSISSRFLTAAHTIRCDLYEDLAPFLENQCMVSSSLTPSNNSNSLYDFTKAEAMLIDRYLTGLPAIDLEQSGFVYTQEQQGAINILRQKLRQERLPVDIIDAIKRDIANPAQAQRILQLLGNVIDFLGATGGAVLQSLGEGLGDMPLIKYARTVLLLEEDFGSRAIARQVKLKHLESLQGLLVELTSSDVFEKVDFAYKQPISESAKKELVIAAREPEFDVDALLGAMKSMILEYLCERSMKPTEKAFECLRYCCIGSKNAQTDEQTELNDVPWFNHHFPRSLLMSEIVEAYKLLREQNI